MATETTKLTYIEGAAASTPAANRVVTYPKADGRMYSKDDAGLERAMTPAVAVLQDQKAQNTAGGTFTTGAWRTRDLNTEVTDASAIVAIATNQFTPIAGTYEIEASAPARAVAEHQTRLQNVTAATTTATGTTEISAAASGTTTRSFIRTVFVANGTDAYEIQHNCSTTAATNGFGAPGNFTTEVYTSIVLTKIA